jgi:ubiquinone/menaquinone biosynthesis C-methylase UbiE
MDGFAMNAIDSTHEAYERWAPRYPPEPHNPLMRVEQTAMLAQWPDVSGRRSLDLACGTGRYGRLLQESGAREVVALDFSATMLAQVAVGHRVRADMLQLPFVDASFGIVICGLAVGHAADLHRWMREVARVLDDGGVLLYSEFHPLAARAGLTRSFKDACDRSVTVPHCCHEISVQHAAVADAGLTLEVMHEVRAGVELREEFAGSEGFYRQWRGLPLALIVRARK